MIEALGMAGLLQNSKCWENPPLPNINISSNDTMEEYGDMVDEEVDHESDMIISEILPEINLSTNPQPITAGIAQHNQARMISNDLNIIV